MARFVRVLAATIALALAAVAGACTPEPSPTPAVAPQSEPQPLPPPAGMVAALSTVVVLPPASRLDDVHAQALVALLDGASATSGDVREIRGVVPDGPAFVADLAEAFADRSTRLVCVLGDRAVEAVQPLVTLYPEVRFCALPVDLERGGVVDLDAAVSDPVVQLELRAEELGHLVGLAAREHAAGAAVGVVLEGDELPGRRFRAGVLAGLHGVEVVEAPRSLPLEERLARVVEAEVAVLVVDGGAGIGAALETLPDGIGIVAPTSLAEGVEEERRVASWEVRWDTLVRHAVERSRSAAPPGRATSFGLAQRAFDLRPGPGATEAVGVQVERAKGELLAGTRDPREPAPDPPGVPQEDDDEVGSALFEDFTEDSTS